MNADARRQFSDAVTAELALMHRFVALLEQERDILVSHRTDGLLELAEKKTELYRQLQNRHAQSNETLKNAGIVSSDDDVRAWLAPTPDILASWNALMQATAEARECNELNGRLIREHMQHNQAALSVLLSANEQPLYDAEGAARPSGRGRHLGSA